MSDPIAKERRVNAIEATADAIIDDVLQWNEEQRRRCAPLKPVSPMRTTAHGKRRRRMRAIDIATAWLFDPRHSRGLVIALLDMHYDKPTEPRSYVARARFGSELSPLHVTFPSRDIAERWVVKHFPYLTRQWPRDNAHAAVVVTWRSDAL